MDKWADYLISEVSYDSEHLISIALRHQETEQGITKGKPIDRLTIVSDIKNGFLYITIYSGKNSWKKGHRIHTFSIDGTPYLRIDSNKVKLDYLGDLPEFPITESEDEATPEQLARLEQLEKQIEKLESYQEPIVESKASSSRGSLPKDSTEELPQELDLAPEPITESEDEATPEQLARLNELQQQIDELENLLSSQILSESNLDEDEATPEQLSQLNELQQQIDELENILSYELNHTTDKPIKQIPKDKKLVNLEETDIENKIIKTLQKQNQKLDKIEKKLHDSEKPILKSDTLDAYCVKCKTKRPIENPEETTMKNGRPAIRGICSICKCKVFRIVKSKK